MLVWWLCHAFLLWLYHEFPGDLCDLFIRSEVIRNDISMSTYLPLDEMATVAQTTFSDAFSWMKSCVFWLKFQWSLFLRVQFTIIQYTPLSEPMLTQFTRGRWVYHCGLVTPCHNIDLGQHRFRWWLGAWKHQAMTWTNVDLERNVFCGIRLRAISQEVLKNLIRKISSEMTLLRSQPCHAGINELIILAGTEPQQNTSKDEVGAIFGVYWTRHHITMTS